MIASASSELQRRPVRALGRERLVDVRQREQPHRQRELGGGQAARIAAAVEALVVGARDRRDVLAARDARQDLLGDDAGARLIARELRRW